MASFSTTPRLLAVDRCRVPITYMDGKSRVSCVQNKAATHKRCVVSATSECQRSLVSNLSVLTTMLLLLIIRALVVLLKVFFQCKPCSIVQNEKYCISYTHGICFDPF